MNDNLANSDLAIDALKNDYLAEDFLADNSLGGNPCTTKDNVKLCNTAYGFDPNTQITAILSADYIRIVRSLNFISDFTFKKDVGKTLLINSSGKSYLIEINDPAGGTKITVNQSN